MGAYYTYSAADYPYLVPNIVVVNEVLAHSHEAATDWIELFNNSAEDLDLGGWYLSDDSGTPMKYRIADNTILPGNGYLVFYENLNFGAGSPDPGALIPFALSENGDTVNIFGPSDGMRPDYNEKETFGASARGVSFGRYYKTSTRTYNFVSMAEPTPGAANSLPLVGADRHQRNHVSSSARGGLRVYRAGQHRLHERHLVRHEHRQSLADYAGLYLRFSHDPAADDGPGREDSTRP